MDLTGGTSGSPIYNTSGKVIAINNASIQTPVISTLGSTTISQGSLGFGIRIDKVNELLSTTEKRVPQTKKVKREIIEAFEGRDVCTLKFHKTEELIKEFKSGSFAKRLNIVN